MIEQSGSESFKENEVANGITCSRKIQNFSMIRRVYVGVDTGGHQ